MLRDIVRLLELDARSRDTHIRLSLQSEPRLVLVDRVQIEQVIVNLVQNAIEAMEQTPRDGRQVKIACRDSDGEAEISIHDQGSGIGDNDLRQLFEPFFTTKPEAWAWGWPSAGRSWTRMADDCGPARILSAA